MSNLLATPTPSALRSPRRCSVALALIVARRRASSPPIPALRAGRAEHRRRARARPRRAVRRARRGRPRRRRAAPARRPPASASRTPSRAAARATLTVGALTMMVITLVAALSMEATYDRVIDDPALRAKPWDMRVEPGAIGQARAGGARRARRRARDDDRRPPGHRAAAATSSRPARSATASSTSRTPSPTGACSPRPGEAIAGRGLFDALGPEGRRHAHRCAPAASRSRSRSSAATSSPTTTARSLIFTARPRSPRVRALGDGEVIAGFAPGTDGARGRAAPRSAGTASRAELVERRGAPGARRRAPDRATARARCWSPSAS